MVAVTKRGGSYYCQHGNEDGKCEVCYYEEWWPANKKSPDCKFDANSMVNAVSVCLTV
jgi:hypothetical protein